MADEILRSEYKQKQSFRDTMHNLILMTRQI